jgi:septum formation protein
MAKATERLILASGSAVRARLLQAAGIAFDVEPAGIDETVLKEAARAAGQSAADCALVLAAEKARHISAANSGSWVIGADQLLVAGDKWFDKPRDLPAARTQLRELRGRAHVLETAVCVVRDGELLWHHLSRPALTMREFSDSFLESYLAAEGETVLASVGAYRLEARGVQLFAAIDGDSFAILGLPLIELLGFLREVGMAEQ